MNIYSIIGFILALVVLLGGLFLSTSNILLFYDPVSIFIVLGGTLAAVSISFPLTDLFKLIKVFFRRVLKGRSVDYGKTIANIVQVSEKYRTGTPIEQLKVESKYHFFTEAMQLYEDGILDTKTLHIILTERIENMYALYMKDTNKFKAMGKYPPAFGMMGTTIGMVVLLANLGGKDAMKTIGPAMGVCLLTTLYGVIISNLAIIPVGENLEDSTQEVYLQNQIILEGFKLMLQKTSPVVLAERLNSFLLPGDRLDWKEILTAKT
jgi:chemotaxis protein MotA